LQRPLRFAGRLCFYFGDLTKMKQKTILNHAKCFKALSLGLGLGVFYALFVVAAPWLSMDLPIAVTTIFWAIIKGVLAYGLLCLYQNTKELKMAIAGILMLASAIFSPFPVQTFMVLAIEALAMTSLSLVLFDLNKIFPGLKLSVPAGLIFLGVIFSILNNPMMHSLAGFAWLYGFLVSSSRVGMLARLRPQE